MKGGHRGHFSSFVARPPRRTGQGPFLWLHEEQRKNLSIHFPLHETRPHQLIIPSQGLVMVNLHSGEVSLRS